MSGNWDYSGGPVAHTHAALANGARCALSSRLVMRRWLGSLVKIAMMMAALAWGRVEHHVRRVHP